MQSDQAQAIEMDAIEALVRERCGLHADIPGHQTVAGAVRRRMAACRVGRLAEYFQRLCLDQRELFSLVEYLTINVSYLYREPLHDSMVFEHVIGPMLARDGAPVRILSAGCACGEELVSLAIAVSERYGEAALDRFTFCGIDIDRAALRVASAGRYGEEAFHALPPALRERYFTPLAGGGGVLHRHLLNRLHYSCANLIDAAALPAPHDQDVIFYRNVSIYFGRAARVLALQHLAARLKNDGVVLTGKSEIRSNDLGVLRTVDHGRFQCFMLTSPGPL